MKVLTIAVANLVRFARDRFNIFFVLVLPLAIVLLIGLQYGDAVKPQVGLVGADTTLGRAIAEGLGAENQIDLRHRVDADAMVDEIEQGDLAAGVIIPDDIDRRIGAGQPVEVGFIASPTGVGPQLQAIVDNVVARATARPTAVAAAVGLGADANAAAAAADDLLGLIALIEVQVATTGDRLFPEDIGGFDVGAPSQLVLFTFLTALTGSVVLIQTRRLGISHRMLSTPTSLPTIIAGEALGRFVIGVVQGIYILIASTVLFGVNWGHLPGAASLLLAFAAVGASAAMLVGSTFDNEEQASGITVILGLSVAALGGAMLPIELFSETMLTIARLTPHYWAIDGFSELIRREGTLGDITTQLGVLIIYAGALGLIAVWRMRRTLTR